VAAARAVIDATDSPSGHPLTTAVIVILVAVVLWFGKRWIDARSEVTALRIQVALLKRRLAVGSR
jgi:hypothetical protein